jgi:hypothetical protein
MAGRAIADAYTQEVLPYGDGLPSMTWNFVAGEPRPGALNLRDHGNEIVAGLAEWIMAESVAAQSQAEKYRPAVEHMMDVLTIAGRLPETMIVDGARLIDGMPIEIAGPPRLLRIARRAS